MTKTADIGERYERGWLDSLDSRTALARDLRSRYDAIVSDLGGLGSLSYMQRSLIERGLWLERFLVLQEQRLAEHGDDTFEASRWIQAVNSLQGIYSRLGLERRAKQVPALGEYLRSAATSEAAQ